MLILYFRLLHAQKHGLLLDARGLRSAWDVVKVVTIVGIRECINNII